MLRSTSVKVALAVLFVPAHVTLRWLQWPAADNATLQFLLGLVFLLFFTIIYAGVVFTFVVLNAALIQSVFAGTLGLFHWTALAAGRLHRWGRRRRSHTFGSS